MEKFHWNRKIELATNAEYASTRCANHEKPYFTLTKNQFLWSKFFRQKFRWTKFLRNWKIEFSTNAEYDSAWCANHEKLYLSPSKNQFLRSKFFGLKLRWKKYPSNWKIELGKKCRIWLSVVRWSRKTIF